MQSPTICRPFEILLVEDNSGDVDLMVEAFQESDLWHNLHIVRDGEAALQFLHRQQPYGDRPRPDLILLDLNLPKVNGQEVLAQIKTDPNLRRIPVVVLSTSASEWDIRKSYDLHANCYINKPVNFEKFLTVMKAIEDFWLTIVKLPREPEM